MTLSNGAVVRRDAAAMPPDDARLDLPVAPDGAAPNGMTPNDGTPDGVAPDASLGVPRSVTDQLLEELSAWSAFDRRRMFKAWHRGSLSLIHLHVLAVLEAEAPLPMSRLADALDVSVASATGIVDRMEQRELVVRHHDVADRRLVLVTLTDGGSEVFRALADQRRAHLEALVTRLTEAEANGLLEGLRGLRRARRDLDEATGRCRDTHPHAGTHGGPSVVEPAGDPTTPAGPR